MNERTRKSPGWILIAGLALAALGLAAGSQTTLSGGSAGGPRALPLQPGFGTADSNDRMIAVTGVDVTGGSILYVIDTVARQLAVYTAQGGTSSTMSLKFIGGRNIDLDLQVNGYNDKSEYSFTELAERFSKSGAAAPPK